ncbi:MAG: HlyD family secretion protein [Pseudohongiellaceae bacterium]|jgi:HlyD family secretion protein
MSAQRKRSIWPVVLTIAVLGGAGWAAMTLTGEDPSANRAIAGATAVRGPLKITVVERGNLEAADAVTLKSEIEGQSTVLYLIDEGSYVEVDELLCELDNSALVDRQVSQEIRVQNAEAAFVKAKQNHAIQVSQNESDVAKSVQELDFAGLDLEKYVDGDMPQESKSKDEAILLADEELSRAQQDLEWSKRLNEKGFLEQAQLDADELAKTRSVVKLNQAKRAKELFEDYEIPRRKKELESMVTEKQRELVRVKLQAGARLADFDANWRTTDATLTVEKAELEKLASQIEKSRIVAPVAGMVVYARDSGGRYGGGEAMKEGANIRERQAIITIPSSDGFIAEASLHESVLEKVVTGMACAVTVDALHETFPGEVSYKALLPDQNSWFANPDLRVYKTNIRVLSEDPRIRPGMSCSIEIMVDTMDDAVQLPVQTIFLDAGEPVVFVETPTGPEKRAVTVGQNNGRWVHIIDGVDEGEVALMARPPGIELLPAAQRSENSTDGSSEQGDSEGGGKAPQGDSKRGDSKKGGDRPGRGSGEGSTASHNKPSSPGASKQLETSKKGT